MSKKKKRIKFNREEVLKLALREAPNSVGPVPEAVPSHGGPSAAWHTSAASSPPDATSQSPTPNELFNLKGVKTDLRRVALSASGIIALFIFAALLQSNSKVFESAADYLFKFFHLQ